MRLYSCSQLSWPEVIHVSQAASLYPKLIRNLNFYKIKQINPLIIKSDSPIELLQYNRNYYCYNNYYRDKRIEAFGNLFEVILNHNNKNTFVFIPKYTQKNDVIVVNNDYLSSPPFFTEIFSSPFQIILK